MNVLFCRTPVQLVFNLERVLVVGSNVSGTVLLLDASRSHHSCSRTKIIHCLLQPLINNSVWDILWRINASLPSTCPYVHVRVLGPADTDNGVLLVLSPDLIKAYEYSFLWLWSIIEEVDAFEWSLCINWTPYCSLWFRLVWYNSDYKYWRSVTWFRNCRLHSPSMFIG